MKKSITLFFACTLLFSLSYGQIRILSVNPGTDEIAIKNFGGSMVDISDYRLCARFVYSQNLTSDVTTVSGSSMLQGGDTLVVSWEITDASSDVGIYLAAGSFGDSAAMVDFMQYGDSGIGREGVANTKGIWTAGEFIDGNAPYTYTGSGSENGLSSWSASEVAAPNLIRFLQVDPTTDAIWIKNFGETEVDISNYRLCSEFVYSTGIGVDVDVDVVSGSTTLAAGDTLELSWLLTDSAADLGLYLPEGLFADTAAMVDFLQWGSGGIGRESVADSKGIWEAGAFISGAAPYTYMGDGTGSGLSGWGNTPPPMEESDPFVRIVKVDPSTDAIYIRNFGEDSVDLAEYRLCSEFIYTGNLSSDVSLLSGSTMLASGDTLGVMWAINDTAADLGLYLPDGSFGDTANIVDFLQWGDSGIGRESVANSKGLWTSGDFIEGFGPYTYTGDGSQNGVAVWMADSIATDTMGTDTMATNLDPALRQQIQIVLYPSLVKDRTTLQMDVPISGDFSLSVMDAVGRIWMRESRSLVPGQHAFDLDLGHLASGLYYVRASLGSDLIGTTPLIKQ